MRTARAIFLLVSIRAFGQPPSFEVADVKVNKSGEVRMAVDMQPGGKLTMRNVPMKVLIMFAYHVRGEAVTGGPGWLESDRFDVIAKAPQTGSPDVRRMLQTLLAERFKLAVHTDEKLMPAFALRVGKNGPKLQSTTDAAVVRDQRCDPGDAPTGQKSVSCQHMTMAVLADTLQELAVKDFPVPIVDQTGLKGAYEFKLIWTPASKATDPLPGLTIFEAVQEQLGLKLESRKLPLPVIVIDRVERVPTDN